MNAPLNPALLAPEIRGKLLTADHDYDETLAIDLYGDWSAEEGANVITVMVAGTQHDITTLFSGRQLECLSRYLDLRGSPDPMKRQIASQYRNQSGRY
jgi:hypothetical protein